MNVMVVGLGLIGASISAKLASSKHHIIGIDSHIDTLNYAFEHGYAHAVGSDPCSYFHDLDVIILALYPKLIPDWIKQYSSKIGKHTVITDVSGVKYFHNDVLDWVPNKSNFMSMHPMAGREKTGILHAEKELFNQANFIVIDHADVSPSTKKVITDLIHDLGSTKIIYLSAARHDDLIAYVSQLTHGIAIALVNADIFDETAQVTGDSFRDLTRIARINENLWSELMLQNKEALINNIDRFMLELTHVKESLIHDDQEHLKEMMKKATAKRGSYS